VADGVELDVGAAVHDRYPRHLGLPVDLLQVDPQGVEKSEVVRPHGGAAGVGVAHPAHPQVVLELFFAPVAMAKPCNSRQ